jgi:YfiH family protein
MSVVFTDRRGGASVGPYSSLNLGLHTADDQAAVLENRRRVAKRVGVPLALSHQVHGAAIREWRSPGGFLDPPAVAEADGHTTTQRNLGLVVLVADCLPVALTSPTRVAMLHCGWRGLAGGIIERALERFEAAPSAAIGPGIGPCCYEVGAEVFDAFGMTPARTIDLKAIAREKLVAAGVESVDTVDLCTSCRPDLFFSHRRDGGVTGRQAGIVWLT